jgi:hypothetical protein
MGGDGDVEEDEVGPVVDGGGHGGDGILGAEDVVAFHLEQTSQRLACLRVVVDDQDGCHAAPDSPLKGVRS